MQALCISMEKYLQLKTMYQQTIILLIILWLQQNCIKEMIIKSQMADIKYYLIEIFIIRWNIFKIHLLQGTCYRVCNFLPTFWFQVQQLQHYFFLNISKELYFASFSPFSEYVLLPNYFILFVSTLSFKSIIFFLIKERYIVVDNFKQIEAFFMYNFIQAYKMLQLLSQGLHLSCLFFQNLRSQRNFLGHLLLKTLRVIYHFCIQVIF